MLRRSASFVAAAAALLVVGAAAEAAPTYALAQGSCYLACSDGGTYLASAYAYYGGGSTALLAVIVRDSSGAIVFYTNQYVPAPTGDGSHATFAVNSTTSVTFTESSTNVLQGAITINGPGITMWRPAGSAGSLYTVVR